MRNLLSYLFGEKRNIFPQTKLKGNKTYENFVSRTMLRKKTSHFLHYLLRLVNTLRAQSHTTDYSFPLYCENLLRSQGVELCLECVVVGAQSLNKLEQGGIFCIDRSQKLANGIDNRTVCIVQQV